MARHRRITADKRLQRYAPSPKLPSVTSFIRKTSDPIRQTRFYQYFSEQFLISVKIT